MKYESQLPVPANPATTAMLMAGVSVGPTAASDWPIVSNKLNAPGRRHVTGLSALRVSVLVLIRRSGCRAPLFLG